MSEKKINSIFRKSLPDITDRKLFRQMHRDKGNDSCKCRYCGIHFSNSTLTKTNDHIISLYLGGVDRIWNVVTACIDCNEWKDHSTLQEWYDELLTALKFPAIRNMKLYSRHELFIMIKNVQQVMHYANKYQEHLKELSNERAKT